MTYAAIGDYNVGRGIFKPGGYGGGVFDGNLSGLGADAEFPWHTYSDATKALQTTINNALSAHGMCTLDTDGKLGAATCGAAKALIGQAPPTCQSFTDPKPPPCVAASAGPAPAPLMPPPASAVTAASMQFGTATDWTKYAAFAVGALAVVGGLWWMNRRKKGNS